MSGFRNFPFLGKDLVLMEVEVLTCRRGEELSGVVEVKIFY